MGNKIDIGLKEEYRDKEQSKCNGDTIVLEGKLVDVRNCCYFVGYYDAYRKKKKYKYEVL